MSGYVLDSDWSIDILNNRPSAVQSFSIVAPAGVAMSVISYAELFQGAIFAHHRDQALAALQSLVSGLQLLPVTGLIAERFAVERGRLSHAARQQLGDMDVFIAATALTHNMTLMTRNLRDFRRIVGLQLFRP